jgi:hypothetical protein
MAASPLACRPLPPPMALVLAMGLHSRLGAESALAALDGPAGPALVRAIAAAAAAQVPRALRVSQAAA